MASADSLPGEADDAVMTLCSWSFGAFDLASIMSFGSETMVELVMMNREQDGAEAR